MTLRAFIAICLAAALPLAAHGANLAPRTDLAIPARASSSQTLIAAGLFASGERDREELAGYEELFAALVADFRAEVSQPIEPRTLAKAAHRFLHARILLHYDAAASDLARTFDDGSFNCVSGSLLMIALAESCGVPAAARQTRGHVWCMLGLGADAVEVETTCAERYLRHSSADDPQARTVSGSELVAMVYFNRAVEHLADQQFADALTANLAALALDPGSPWAKENLLATVNNWAVSLATSGDRAGALRLVTAGQLLDPTYPPFVKNRRRWEQGNP